MRKIDMAAGKERPQAHAGGASKQPGGCDTLLEAVRWICAHHGLTITPAALQAGLPREARLTPSLAVRVLEQAGIASGWVKRDIDALFVASSWTRAEKNYGLLSEIAANVEGMSVHVVGEFDEPIPSAVHHGFVADRATLFQLMGRAKSVVCPSTFDAAPGILFEGSAMGCNVIASRNCGNWELCNDRFLVTDYTADAFAEAIRRARATKLPDNLLLFLRDSSYAALKRLLAD